MRDDDPLKYFPGYAEACAKAEPNNLVPEATPKPERIARRPMDKRGFVIPWNVYVNPEGEPVFTVNDSRKHALAIKERLCPLCGEPNEPIMWFIGGPKSAFHPQGWFLDLPGHLECLEYALQVCPYLAAAKRKPPLGPPLDPNGVPETVILIDYTQDPNRPLVFVLLASQGIIVRVSDRGVYVRPQLPIAGVRFWNKGQRLAHEQGVALAKQALHD